MPSTNRPARTGSGQVFLLDVPPQELTRLLMRQITSDDSSGTPVVWADGDSEIVVYPERLRLALQPGLVLIELMLATDQTGVASLVIPFIIGKSSEDAVLMAVTEEVPRGNHLLASRWGQVVQDALWEALIRVGQNLLRERAPNDSLAVAGVFADTERLSYIVTPPVSAAEISEYYSQFGPDIRELRRTRLARAKFIQLKKRTPRRGSRRA
jgi:hypothetical protein